MYDLKKISTSNQWRESLDYKPMFLGYQLTIWNTTDLDSYPHDEPKIN